MGRRAGIIILLLLFFLSSCAGKREEGSSSGTSGGLSEKEEARPEGSAPVGTDSGGSTGPISLRPTEPGGGAPISRPPQPGGAQPQARSTETLTEQLFAPYLPKSPIFPEDMVIGPLQDTAVKGEVQLLISIADAFLGGLRDGKLADDVVLPEQREALSARFGSAFKKIPSVRWRLVPISVF